MITIRCGAIEPRSSIPENQIIVKTHNNFRLFQRVTIILISILMNIHDSIIQQNVLNQFIQ